MSEFNEPEAPVSDYGRQRRADWLAHHQANSDMAKAAELQAHGQSEDRRVTQAGQQGLWGHMTPQDKAAAVAARQAEVGSAYGGRPLEKLGGTFDHSEVGCAPAQHVWTCDSSTSRAARQPVSRVSLVSCASGSSNGHRIHSGRPAQPPLLRPGPAWR